MARGTIRVENHLSLSRAAHNILLALPDGNAHRHGVKKSIEERIGGRPRMRAGTLYKAVRGLDRWGLIEEIEMPEDCREATSRWSCCRVSELKRQVVGS